MANEISIKLDTSRLDGLPEEVEANASAILMQHALLIEAVAKGKAKVDTGFMRNSIFSTDVEPLLKRVGVGAEYGIYVEFGTSRASAQPYFVPAVEFVKPKLESAWGGLIKE